MPKITKESQYILDIILPKEFRPSQQHAPSDEEARALFEVWKRSPGRSVFSLSENEKKFLDSWKIKGLVAGLSSSLKLTDKGRHLIVEMVTNEPNAFDKTATNKKYSEIVEARKKTGRKRMNKKAFNLSRMRKNAGQDTEQA